MTHASDQVADSIDEFQYRKLEGVWRLLLAAFAAVGIAIAICFVFQLRWQGSPLFETTYFYLLLAVYLSLTFLVLPMAKGKATKAMFALDAVLFLGCSVLCACFAWLGMEISLGGWGYEAPLAMSVAAVVLWILVLEALRRSSGLAMTIVVVAFALLPLVAGLIPGPLRGTTLDFVTLANYHAMSPDSILGIPLGTFGTLLTGFMVFSVALGATGGGKFFIDTAVALAGNARGGAAKVAVIASGFFGSMSGSAVSNVASTGPFTIPAMKASGYSSTYAAAVEACAATGGILMPPVMGAVAFVMANILQVPYLEVAAAAAIPSILYYLTLFVQADGYAAQRGIKVLAAGEAPRLLTVLKKGWIYLVAFAMLIYGLVALQIEPQAPYYATAVLLVLAQFRKESRFTRAGVIDFFCVCGIQLTTLVSILAGVGMILGSLSVTGLGQAIPSVLLGFAGGNDLLLLILGALASFVLGLGLTVIACYIFLVVVLAPPLVSHGFNPMSVHLFLMYWGILSCITPPVALSAYPAAIIARTSPDKVGWTATRLAGALYVLPFLFVYNPALVLQAPVLDIVHSFIMAAVGALFLASSQQGYLIRFGSLESGRTVLDYSLRGLLAAAGVLLMMGKWQFYAVGVMVAMLALGLMHLLRRQGAFNANPRSDVDAKTASAAHVSTSIATSADIKGEN